MNVGNLFNSKWGVEKNMSNCNNGAILKVDKVENGTPYFSMYKNSDGSPLTSWTFNRNQPQLRPVLEDADRCEVLLQLMENGKLIIEN